MIIYSVILDLNNAKDTFLAYKSLLKQNLDTNIEHRFIIVDNGSNLENQKLNISNFEKENFTFFNDSTLDDSCDNNVLIVLKENLGFTGGNNIAFKIAINNNADYILLFNNDAVAREDVIAKLINFSQKKAITGGAIYDYIDRQNIQTLGTHTFGWKGYSTVPKELIKEEKIVVASVSGACMLLPVNILNEIGLFDNNFYLYSEENELSKRALLSSYPSYTISDAKVYHKGSATLGKESNLKFYYLIRNNLYFHKKHSHILHYYLIICYQLGINLIRNIGNTDKLKTLVLAINDALNNKMGKCKRSLK